MGSNATGIATVKEGGTLNRTVYLTIIHAVNNTDTQLSCATPPCSHTVNGKSAYVFQNDNSVVCSQCKTAYVLPTPTGGGKYLEVVDVNATGTAPSHATPYGDATVLTRYQEGDTVYTTGSVKNAFNNTWYQLSSGEWLSAGYLGTHSHCYNSKGFCEECLDSLNVVSMSSTTISLKSGKSSAPVHFAPYGASPGWTVKGNSVTVNGKAVNSYGNVWYRTTAGAWIFSDYLDTPVADGVVKVSDSLNLRIKASSSGTSLAEIPNNAMVTVYTKETSGSWYSVYYNGKVGYASKSFITVYSGLNALEPPVFEETGVEITKPTSPTTPTTPNTPTSPTTPTTPSTPTTSAISVSLLTPTDKEYTSKISVSDHNATVVTKIKKTAGARVTACGLRLYDAAGNLIKEHRETVSNVSDSTTTFHTWYDINKELGVTLDSGTTYQYRFFTVVNGTTYQGLLRFFTTTGTAPAAATETAPVTPPETTPVTPPEAESVVYRLTLNPNGGICSAAYKDVPYNTVVGTLPVPTRTGYTFVGWYTAAEGGAHIGETTLYNVEFDVTLYARWTANQETTAVTNPFADVPSGSYYFDAVIWANRNNITGGTDASHFSPDRACTRAQAVTFLWRAAGSPAPKSSVNPFTDVSKGSYYYSAVLWAVENGITNGTTATTFSPNATCKRAQIVTFLWRAQKAPAAGTANPFTDVAADAYYANAVLWAAKNGITGGTTATTFSPNATCKRAQIVTFLYRCLG
ncbi:S-layer homology domain-containing protein [Dysosmobacter sp.]|uniref:S-layer homology domain-containing protein n=1 Tax=Dysosmobacter sp. TaxID=2591382 RepID=UPI002A9039E5|nr:S-layer homology domain-containing protein [Dysosmobacter sp.]MDY3281650.1 S-layer homology domain-containing protein [Dysosmobacter sp.]